MKILVLTSTYPCFPGDSQPGFIKEFCENLALAGHEVSVLAPHGPKVVDEEVDPIDVTRFRYFFSPFESLAYGSGVLENLKQNPIKFALIPFFIFGMCWGLIRLLNKSNFDVIHAHWIIPQGLVAAICLSLLRKKTPMIVTSHGADLFALNSIFFRPLKRWVIMKAAKLAVVSEAMKSYSTDNLKVPSEHIVVAPMGVDLENKFKVSVTPRYSNRIVFVGRLVEKKGVNVLIQAFSQLIKSGLEAELFIVGDGVRFGELQRLATKLKVSDSVVFTGGVCNKQVSEILSTSSIAVVPSVVSESGDQEGLGLVLIEALGCGCAVLASDLPAIKDVIIDGETGLTFQAGSVEDLARSLSRLLSDRALRSKLAVRGRKFVMSKYDWSSVTEKYEAVFRDVIIF